MPFLSGCFNMTPEFRQPDLGIETPQSFQLAAAEQTSNASVTLEDRWWEVFGDPDLNLLVDDVLQNNWDIKQAADRILETRYRYIQVRSDRFPTLDIEGGYDRRKTGGGRIDQGVTFDTFDIGLAAAYELDLWGRLASARTRQLTKSCRRRKISTQSPRQSLLKPSIFTCKSKPWNDGYRLRIRVSKPSAAAWSL